MTEETSPSEIPEETDTPEESGASESPATRLQDSVDKEYRALDDFPPELRDKVEQFSRRQASKAVNETLSTKRDKGEFLTKEDLDTALKQRDEQWQKKNELQTNLERTLLQVHDIAVGSPEYDKFAEASKLFKVDALRSEEGIASIVRAAGLAKPEASDSAKTVATSLYGGAAPRGTDGKVVDIPPEGVALKFVKSSEN